MKIELDLEKIEQRLQAVAGPVTPELLLGIIKNFIGTLELERFKRQLQAEAQARLSDETKKIADSLQ